MESKLISAHHPSQAMVDFPFDECVATIDLMGDTRLGYSLEKTMYGEITVIYSKTVTEIPGTRFYSEIKIIIGGE